MGAGLPLGGTSARTAMAPSPANGGAASLATSPAANNSTYFPVNFTQVGLPGGTSWSVTLAGTTHGSSGVSVLFSMPNGSYPWSVNGVANYSVFPSSGTAIVAGASVHLSLTFYRPASSITFSETTLPAGSAYSVTLANTTRSSSNGTIVFSEPNGTYPWSVGSIPAGYAASPSHGSVVLAGSAVRVTITFAQLPYGATFDENGLPTGTSWSVTVGSTTRSTTTSSVTFLEPNGTYGWSVGLVPGYTTAWNGQVTVSGSIQTVLVNFTPTRYAITFTESGLAPGTNWSVSIGASSQSSTTSSLVLDEPNGNYTWTVRSVLGYTSTGSGAVAVRGGPARVAVGFTVATYSVSFNETGLASGASWYVDLNGTNRSSTGTSILFSERHGSYPYLIGCGGGELATPSNGTASVGYGPVTIAVSCANASGLVPVSFSESGLPAGSTWSVELTPVLTDLVVALATGWTLSAPGGDPITFHVPPGSYDYTASSDGYVSASGAVIVNTSPTSTPTSVSFTPSPPNGGALGALGLSGSSGPVGLAVIALLLVATTVALYWRGARETDRGRLLVDELTKAAWESDEDGEPSVRLAP